MSAQIIPFPLDRIRPRRPIRRVTFKGTRQAAPADVCCRGCGALIAFGTMHWLFSSSEGALVRRCNDCAQRGL